MLSDVMFPLCSLGPGMPQLQAATEQRQILRNLPLIIIQP